MKKLLKILILFMVGGISYLLIELAYRGRTHWSMILVGGICFVLLGAQNEMYTGNMPLLWQCVIGALIITTVEFVAGYIINIRLGWNVWDYSNLPFNLQGQICLLFTGLWMLLSAPAIILDDYLRYWFFGEEKPQYIIFGGKKK